MDLAGELSQKDFGLLIGVSQQAVSDMMQRGILPRNGSGFDWLRGYCSHIREMAAGRSLVLEQERARLACEQADKVAMQNAITRREYAPVEVLEMVIGKVGRQIAETLEALPVQLKRRSSHLTVEDLEIIQGEIAKARNLAANMQIELDEFYGQESNTGGGSEGLEDLGSSASDASV